MKVNFGGRIGTTIKSLAIGETFVTERSNEANGVGLYMKVDVNSGIIRNTQGRCAGVNLSTGQIRLFNSESTVTKADTEVNFV